jgi:voltage-gated potassium channel
MSLSSISFIDALYTTVITISTVGFGEPHPFNEYEKLFTIFLILISVTVYGYVVSITTEYIANGKLLYNLKLKKLKNQIQSLKGHTIVCGYGRNGMQAVKMLKQYQRICVVIDDKKEHLIHFTDEDLLFVQGNATDDQNLMLAGIKQATCLISSLPSDADNLFVVLSARQLNPNCTIISRASNESSFKKLKFAGANSVIMPNKLGGEHMAYLLVNPDLVEFMEKLTSDGKIGANLEEISVDELPENLLGKTISDLKIKTITGCTVIGFKTENNEYIINPTSHTLLKKNTRLIVLGNEEQIKKLKDMY